ncbi:Bsl5585 protein [alpha proteobacterium U9-1i]|nr:Bsl5585 protein [alpha proteobacterium U9-1i]
MNANETARLGAYLSKLLGSPTVSVVSKSADLADVLVDGKSVAELLRDEDEGELSYSISLAVPRAPGAKKNAPIDEPERVRLQGALRQVLHAADLDVRARPRKTDSAEVYVHGEFVGTVSVDEDEGQVLTMSILDIDLDGE